MPWKIVLKESLEDEELREPTDEPNHGETLTRRKRGSRSKGEERENRETVDEEKDTRYSRGWARTLEWVGARGGCFSWSTFVGKLRGVLFLILFFLCSPPAVFCVMRSYCLGRYTFCVYNFFFCSLYLLYSVYSFSFMHHPPKNIWTGSPW